MKTSHKFPLGASALRRGQPVIVIGQGVEHELRGKTLVAMPRYFVQPVAADDVLSLLRGHWVTEEEIELPKPEDKING